MTIVPLPLALSFKPSFVPEDKTLIAKPEPAAALLIFKPVTAEAVEVSTLNVGLVMPAGPTAKALSLVVVIISEVIDSDTAANVPSMVTLPPKIQFMPVVTDPPGGICFNPGMP